MAQDHHSSYKSDCHQAYDGNRLCWNPVRNCYEYPNEVHSDDKYPNLESSYATTHGTLSAYNDIKPCSVVREQVRGLYPEQSAKSLYGLEPDSGNSKSNSLLSPAEIERQDSSLGALQVANPPRIKSNAESTQVLNGAGDSSTSTNIQSTFSVTQTISYSGSLMVDHRSVPTVEPIRDLDQRTRAFFAPGDNIVVHHQHHHRHREQQQQQQQHQEQHREDRFAPFGDAHLNANLADGSVHSASQQTGSYQEVGNGSFIAYPQQAYSMGGANEVQALGHEQQQQLDCCGSSHGQQSIMADQVGVLRPAMDIEGGGGDQPSFHRNHSSLPIRFGPLSTRSHHSYGSPDGWSSGSVAANSNTLSSREGPFGIQEDSCQHYDGLATQLAPPEAEQFQRQQQIFDSMGPVEQRSALLKHKTGANDSFSQQQLHNAEQLASYGHPPVGCQEAQSYHQLADFSQMPAHQSPLTY